MRYDLAANRIEAESFSHVAGLRQGQVLPNNATLKYVLLRLIKAVRLIASYQ